jgi:transcriptional regulator NrdR family protein
MIHHEHEIFVNTIMAKVKVLKQLVKNNAVAYIRYGNDYSIKKRELAKEIDTLEKDIENSIYLKLDEVGE